MDEKENLTSKIAFQVVAGFSDLEIQTKHGISEYQLKRVMRSGDFEILSKAYQQLVGVGNGNVSENLSVKEALGNIVLGFLKPNKRPRRDVISLLDVVLDDDTDSNLFLKQYEKHHNIYWEDLS